MREPPWLDPWALPSPNCSTRTPSRPARATARSAATPLIPPPTTTTSASRVTARSYVVVSSRLLQSARHPCGGPTQRRVGLSPLRLAPVRLGVLELTELLGDLGVKPLTPERELALRDAHPLRELAHHLQRRHALASFDARDVRRAA